MSASKMRDICANCGMTYGRHQLVGDHCPKRGKWQEYLPSRFKLKKKPRSTKARK